MSKNNDYTTGNLLDYEYFSNHYKLIAIDLSKQIELENTDLKQQINFIGKFEEDNTTIFFIIETIKSSFFYSDAFILVTRDITVTADNDTDVALKIVHHFLHVRQKLMMCLLIKQIILTLQLLCTI